MKRPSIVSTILLLFSGCCFFGLIAGLFFFDLTRRAEIIFGSPSKELSVSQQMYFSARLLLQTQALTNPLDLQGTERHFNILIGQSTLEITNQLQSQGFISNADAMRDFLIYTGMDRTLQAGEYNLSSKMSSIEISHTLQDATPHEIIFQILAGWRLEEIAAALPTSGLEFSPELFLIAVNHPPHISAIIDKLPTDASLEGFLYPDSYRVPRDISLEVYIHIVLQDFEIKVNQNIQEGFKKQGFDLFQAVTLASIIQREAVIKDEMPIIASVFYNRLASGMKLETDPTVQYALGYISSQKTWWKNPLILKDLQYESLYNTYLYSGLPPGPICNPSLDALRAVAFPAQTPYYYFRAGCDDSGHHIFAVTFEEHNLNQCP